MINLDNLFKATSHKLEAPKHEDIKRDNFQCIVVDGKGDDLIFQFFSIKISSFNALIAEIIEDHFGSTDGFAIEYVPEMGMYGLLAKDLKSNPLFSKEAHVIRFLDLVDKTVTEYLK